MDLFFVIALVGLIVGLPLLIIGRFFVSDSYKAKKFTFTGALLLIPQLLGVIYFISMILVMMEQP